MVEQSSTVTGDLTHTLRQVTNDAQRLESGINRLTESLKKRGLQLSSELDDIMWSVRQGLESARKQSEEVVNQSTRLQELVRASALITTSLELDQVLQEVMDSVISLTGAERAYLMLREGEGDELVIRAARNWDRGKLSEADAEFSRSVVAAAFAQREPILTMNAQADQRFHEKQSVIGYALRSILCIPLMLDRQVVGVLYADNRLKAGLFNKDSVQLLSAFGTQAAIAIEKARLHGEDVRRQRLEKELSVAREIQFSLLPKACPAVAGWDFAAAYQPARLVGGDFYDFFDLPGAASRLGIVIADVADKGVPAALFMALSRTIIRTTALSSGEPAAALRQANDLILQDSIRSNIFLSAFYAALEPSSGAVTYTNAGHNRPFWYRAAEGDFQDLAGSGIVLGLFQGIRLSQHEFEANPGDLLIFYTDGVTEAMDSEGREFGEERLRNAIRSRATGGADQVVQAIMDAIKAFTGDAPQSDDVTMVVVKRLD